MSLPLGSTGVQVMQRLRVILGYDIPALILTADTSTKTLGEIANHGYVHRAKPVRGEDLTSLIRRLLAERRSTNRREALRSPPVFVVDDDAAVCAALRDTIEAKGRLVEVYGSAREFLDAWLPGRAGCLVLDCQMPGMCGTELLEYLKGEGKQLPSIMITSYGDVPLAIRAMQAGAASFLQKPVRSDELLAAIDRALELAHGSDERTALSGETTALIASLTVREREVLDQITRGKSNKQIALILGVSHRTVENHRAAMMKKLGARSLSEVVRLTIDTSPAVDPGKSR
jgi:two-component system, chemotaxis family, CheB/CheR fusion protein